MIYSSTRASDVRVPAAEAISRGISPDGGLYVPTELPRLTPDTLQKLSALPYDGRAAAVLSEFLTDFTADEVTECTTAAYASGRFRHEKVAPLTDLAEGEHILELWHGPTCAFKDMALQILPHLMRVSAGKMADGKEIVILVATSGDTGKAALEGFRDAAGTRILVFYPEDGVSPMQKLQMATQEGDNLSVCAIRGNFDDAQAGVKAIFTDREVGQTLAVQNMQFSSANSINWGRLVPQIVYYISAYCDLLAAGKIRNGDPINVAVPTGNFGNILAAYYAREMGLPIARLICASNRNRVLTDFIETGVYDRNRAFYTTSSPSMDILVSSNLERLLWHLSGKDDAVIRDLMAQLAANGRYEVSPAVKAGVQELLVAGCCDDEETAATIRDVFAAHHYLLDTHTAVAVKVYRDYRAKTGDTTPTVIASTANPYKFSASVLTALGGAREELDEFGKVEALHTLTGCEIPAPLASLRGKPVRFTGSCERDKASMKAVVFGMLGITE